MTDSSDKNEGPGSSGQDMKEYKALLQKQGKTVQVALRTVYGDHAVGGDPRNITVKKSGGTVIISGLTKEFTNQEQNLEKIEKLVRGCTRTPVEAGDGDFRIKYE